MEPFVYTALPARVVFGNGTIDQVATEISRLGCRRALILSTPPQRDDAQRLAAQLGDLSAGVFAGAVMHTPVQVTDEAVRLARELGADCTVAIGGGSTIGLGKAIAFRTDLPQLVIPTTYAGSEATSILGETSDGRKLTQRSPKILPEVIIYDVDLTLTLPVAMTVTSGLNAIAHAAEAMYARDANPVITSLAEQGIATLARALPTIVNEPGNRDARSDALFGAWACGTCLGAVGMALHHKLCHVLGGSFDLPHAETHTVILPYALAYNAAAAPAAMGRVARALGVAEAASGLYQLTRRLGGPLSLREIGMPESGLDRAADIAVAAPYWNPRPIEREAIRALLQDAFEGRPPQVDTLQPETRHA
jgi:alcohol dehydrogenase class IV